ncbi:MAG: hypothetical protein IKA10_03580 [Oscillospiraceae bacterium]|nr:hypothetical protein [Oscillospiraceae bacterium]
MSRRPPADDFFLTNDKAMDVYLGIIFVCGSMACGNSASFSQVIGGEWMTSRIIAIICGMALYFTSWFRFMEIMGFKPLTYAMSIYLFTDSCIGNILVTFGKGVLMPVTSVVKMGFIAVIAVIYVLLKLVEHNKTLTEYHIKDEGLELVFRYTTDIFAITAFSQLGEIVFIIEKLTGFNITTVSMVIFFFMHFIGLFFLSGAYWHNFGYRLTSKIVWPFTLLYVGGIIEHGPVEYYNESFLKPMFEALGLM